MLISLLIAVLIFGALFYVIGLIPLEPPFKQIAYIILAIIFVLWLLQLLPIAGFPRTLLW